MRKLPFNAKCVAKSALEGKKKFVAGRIEQRRILLIENKKDGRNPVVLVRVFFVKSRVTEPCFGTGFRAKYHDRKQSHGDRSEQRREYETLQHFASVMFTACP